MEITQVLHTAMLVSNLEAAAQFYEGMLGLVRVDRILNYPGIWYQVGDYQIHLIHEPQFLLVQSNLSKWGRNPHLALAVKDLNLVKTTLDSAGYPYQESASGRSALFTQDPDGNIIELSQI